MTDPGPGRALVAAVALGALWAVGGPARVLAGVTLLALLVTPLSGTSALRGLAEVFDATIMGKEVRSA